MRRVLERTRGSSIVRWMPLTAALIAGAGAQQSPPPVIHGGQPAVSADGSHIAFVSNRDGDENIFVISADGNGEQQLTHTAEEKSSPGWTLDGRQVLFSIFANGTSRIYSIGADGKNQHPIGSVPGRSPQISPEGKRVVASVGSWTDARLMLSGLDGSEARAITDESSPVWMGMWSRDGAHIAFTRRDASGLLGVWVMNADGTERRQVTHIPAAEGQAQYPGWSPDGRQLAVQAGRYSKTERVSHIWVVDVVTGDARKLAAHDQPYLDETPSWFPDGKRIAFQSNRTGRMEIWVMNADGSEPQQVTK
jgi:TolB protein